MEAAIYVQNLTKVYRVGRHREGVWGGLLDLVARRSQPVKAVDNLSFSIEPGETVGLIGPNGAGKSTTIKMLTGILKPTTGEVQVLGVTPSKERNRHAMQIGVVFGQRTQLWWDLAVIEAFRLLGKIYRVPPADFEARLAHFNRILELEDLLHRQVRKLSLGQRVRCDLAASLLHNPPVLFLDEPTIGMDVAVKARMRTFIKEIRKNYGTTIILTTHDTADIEELSERLMMIDKGMILFDGSLARFKESYGRTRTLYIDFTAEVELESLRALIVDSDVKLLRPMPKRVEIVFDRNAYTAQDLIGKIGAQFPIGDFSTAETAVETIVRDIYEGFYA